MRFSGVRSRGLQRKVLRQSVCDLGFKVSGFRLSPHVSDTSTPETVHPVKPVKPLRRL